MCSSHVHVLCTWAEEPTVHVFNEVSYQRIIKMPAFVYGIASQIHFYVLFSGTSIPINIEVLYMLKKQSGCYDISFLLTISIYCSSKICFCII